MPRAALPVAPLLGPFAAVFALVEEALARSSWYAEKGVPLSVLTASLAAQWTAAVDVVLSDPACRAEPALTTRVLTQAYKGWWQSLGLSTSLPAAWQAAPFKPRPKPKPEMPLWALLLQAALVPPGQPPIPAPTGPISRPRGLGLGSSLLPPTRDEGPQK